MIYNAYRTKWRSVQSVIGIRRHEVLFCQKMTEEKSEYSVRTEKKTIFLKEGRQNEGKGKLLWTLEREPHNYGNRATFMHRNRKPCSFFHGQYG